MGKSKDMTSSMVCIKATARVSRTSDLLNHILQTFVDKHIYIHKHIRLFHEKLWIATIQANKRDLCFCCLKSEFWSSSLFSIKLHSNIEVRLQIFGSSKLRAAALSLHHYTFIGAKSFMNVFTSERNVVIFLFMKIEIGSFYAVVKYSIQSSNR